MSEVVGLPDTDDRDDRAPDRERLGGESVGASMMGNLENVDLSQCARTFQSAPHGFLCVTREQRREAAAHDLEHHAGVVGVESRVRLLWPEHSELASANAQSVPGHECLGRVRLPRRCEQALHVAAHRCERLVIVCDRHEHTLYPRKPDEAGDSSGVVRVVVGQDERIESPNALARKRDAERIRVPTGVHEDRSTALTDKGRVTLADVEHRQSWSGSNGRAHREHGQEHRDTSYDTPRVATGCRKRPPGPHDRT
ncbi:MAG: hypothetical protein K0B85_07050 [Coriobacteriia bacterium]|nr:hypothetical protein [Coriobacteriia bacterium]